MTIPNPDAREEVNDSPIFYIDFNRMIELHRSPVAVIAARRGPDCPSLLKPDHELNDPQELVDEIAEFCRPEEGFIQSEMPLQEIVFRVLLSRRNRPSSLRDLHYELTENWATPIRPISVSEEGLERILVSDTYYGFTKQTPD